MAARTPPPQLPTFRILRVPAWLQIGSWHAPAQTASVNGQKLYLRVPHGSSPDRLPEPGEPVAFRLEIPDRGGFVTGRGEVTWVDPGDADAQGRRALGVRIRVAEVTEGSVEALAHLARDWRPIVGLAGMRAEDAKAIHDILDRSFEVLSYDSVEGMAEETAERALAMVLARLEWRKQRELEALRKVAQQHPKMRIALMLPRGEDAFEHLDQVSGLARFVYHLPESFRPSELLQVVHRGVEAWSIDVENGRLSAELEAAHARLARENTYLRRRAQALADLGFLVGNSAALRQALADLERIRQSDAPVHIQGETGTGKELVARAIHFGGPRSGGPFVAQNCAGLSEQLLESSLFGHRRGAFTGAERDHAGVFEQAHGGTLFLDEVAELSPRVQAALLRAVEYGEITPLGATAPVRVDVRIVSATHADLRAEVKQGRFREDLFFRLVVLSVSLPPLREREGDVAILARHFLRLQSERHGKSLRDFAPDALRALEAWRWPGNVRELEHEIERAVVLADDGELLPASALSPQVRAASQRVVMDDGQIRVPWGLPYDAAIELLESALIERALAESGGVVAEAARKLGMERSRLAKRLSSKGGGGR